MPEPRHFSIVVIDIESSGDLDGPQKVEVREDLYRIVKPALEAGGIECKSEDRGDGIYLLVDSAISIRRLIHPFIATVDAALADRRVGDPRLRLRMVVHQGAVSLDQQGSSGGAVDLAFAMVDAPQLRDALKQAKSGRIAVVVTEEVYRDVVRGHDEPDPTAFRVHLLETKRGPLRTFVTVTGAADQPASSSPPPVKADEPATEPGTMHIGDRWSVGHAVTHGVMGRGNVTFGRSDQGGEH